MKSVERKIEKLLLLLFFAASPFLALSQQYRIIPFAGYTLKESFDFAGKRGIINASAHYGGIFEFRIKRNYSIELLFQLQDTKTEFTDSISHREVNTIITWYMAGGLNYHQFGESKFSSIAGLYVGLGNVANTDKNVNASRFGAGLKAGVLYEISQRVGIRVQSQVLMMLGGPGSIWGVDNVGTYGTIVQAGFSGGIVISFGNKTFPKPGEGS